MVLKYQNFTNRNGTMNVLTNLKSAGIEEINNFTNSWPMKKMSRNEEDI